MAKAEQQKANSASLRALAEALLDQTFTDMQKQLQATAAAFHLNVQEIKSAKSQMEDRLAEVEARRGCLNQQCCDTGVSPRFCQNCPARGRSGMISTLL